MRRGKDKSRCTSCWWIAFSACAPSICPECNASGEWKRGKVLRALQVSARVRLSHYNFMLEKLIRANGMWNHARIHKNNPLRAILIWWMRKCGERGAQIITLGVQPIEQNNSFLMVESSAHSEMKDIQKVSFQKKHKNWTSICIKHNYFLIFLLNVF